MRSREQRGCRPQGVLTMIEVSQLAIALPRGHYLYFFLGREAEKEQRGCRPQGVLTVTEETTRSLLAQLPC